MEELKASAIAYSNLPFILYWGKKDSIFNLPMNTSLSVGLSEFFTKTTICFSKKYKQDQIFIKYYRKKKKRAEGREFNRVMNLIRRARSLSGCHLKVKVLSENSFPEKVGLNTSASAFASISKAIVSALSLGLTEKELSIFTRRESGSSCRSIPGGFVEWKEGKDDASSYSFQIAPSSYWKLVDLVILVSLSPEKMGITASHLVAPTSEYFRERLLGIEDRINRVREGIKSKNLEILGEAMEEDMTSFHLVTMTSRPSTIYWQAGTLQLIRAVREWRKAGLPVYCNVLGGANVHLLAEDKDLLRLTRKVKKLGFRKLVVNKPAPGVKELKTHLF